MSEKLTIISDATNDATTANGGGDARHSSEKGEQQLAELAPTQVQDPHDSLQYCAFTIICLRNLTDRDECLYYLFCIGSFYQQGGT